MLSTSEMQQQAREVEQLAWHDDVSAALENARHEGRGVLVLFAQPDCDECLRLQAMTLNDSYIRMRLAQFELARGRFVKGSELAKRYGVNSAPALIRLTPDGKVLARREGMLTKDELLDMLRAQTNAANKNLSTTAPL